MAVRYRVRPSVSAALNAAIRPSTVTTVVSAWSKPGRRQVVASQFS